MVALELNLESCNYARSNVEKNNLKEFIEVIHQDDPSNIFGKLSDRLALQPLDFCMCNPPFFNSLDESNPSDSIKKNRTGRRPLPHNGKTGINCELIVDGGECEFVQRIIDESCQLTDRIKVYTTMLGHKSSVDRTIKMLVARGITNFCQTEFCQGHTTRWGMAWTFRSDIYLRMVPVYGQLKFTDKTFTHHLQPSTDDDAVAQLFRMIEKNLLSVSVTLKDIEFSAENCVTFKGVAPVQNTWSRQRQRRRELDRLHKPHVENEINARKEVNQIDAADHEPSAAKKRKLDDSITDVVNENRLPFLVFQCSVERRDFGRIDLSLKYLYGDGGKDGAYQIFQFLINRLKK